MTTIIIIIIFPLFMSHYLFFFSFFDYLHKIVLRIFVIFASGYVDISFFPFSFTLSERMRLGVL